MPCNHKCTTWNAKKPPGGKRYESGQIRCDTCQVFMYPSLEHTHNTKTKQPDDNPENGLSCNCCNMRVSGRAYSAKYGKYQNTNNAKTFEQLLAYIQNEMVMQENYQPIVLRKILLDNEVTKSEIEQELKKHNPDSSSQSMTDTVLTVLQRERNNMIRKEGDVYVINSSYGLSEVETEQLVSACEHKIKEFESRKNLKVLTFKDAAIKILEKSDEPLHYKEITDLAIKNGFIVTEGRTPELSLLRDITEDIRINKGESVFKKIGNGIYTLNKNHIQRFFIALGPWSNWEHTINNPPFRWGVNPSSASNVGVFDALRPGDVVYYYANQDKPTPFSKRGLFGVGKVTRKYDEGTERYWPDEKLKDEIIYKHRFEIESFKLIQSDSELLPWIDGLPFTKGLNRIANEDTLKQLIENTEKLWGLKINSSELRSEEKLEELSVNYYIITQNEGSRYDDIPGVQYAYDSDKSHYKNFVKGTNFIVQTKIGNQNYFVGYGKVGSVFAESPRTKDNGRRITDIVAKFSEYTEFAEKKIRTEEINKKMLDFAFPSGKPNIPPAMLPIDKNFYDEIISGEIKTKTMSEKAVTNSPLIFPRTNLDSIKEEIKKELLIDDHIIDQIISSLYSGKNVLLTGPVGTGKTHLAQLIPKLAWKEIGGYYPQTVTATSDWTTQDVIGGIFPKIENEEITYLIQKGCVAETVSKNWEDKVIDGHEYAGVWLVIDEFNRANIDKAFGQLFTALEYKTLDIPTTDPNLSSEKLTIPEDYRIIGTLNTFDKHFLFRLSDALKRRFSFIEILPPTYSKKSKEMKFVAEKAIKGLREVQEEFKINSYDDVEKNSQLMSVLENLYEIMAYVRLTKNLGTALLISMFRFILINYLITKDWDKSLDQALMTNLLPQLESLQYWQIDSVMNFVGGRIHEMFRRFDIRNRPDTDRYEEELKTLTKYLKTSGKNKNAHNWNTKFRTGELMREDKPVSDLDPWDGISRPNLRNFRTALEGLKQEKGFFETEDMSDDSQ